MSAPLVLEDPAFKEAVKKMEAMIDRNMFQAPDWGEYRYLCGLGEGVRQLIAHIRKPIREDQRKMRKEKPQPTVEDRI